MPRIKTKAILDPDKTPRQARADRILDVAGDLMLRYGYKRITVDDIADQAGIGKGTIYQHWKTREALFTAVYLREFAAAIDEVLDVLRKDPQDVLLHRMVSILYLVIMRRPLLRAIYTADLDTLGSMVDTGVQDIIDPQDNSVFRSYLRLHIDHHLVRQDLDADELFFAFLATLTGYFTFETFNPGLFALTDERKAALIADALQRTFEVVVQPAPEVLQAIAGRTIELLAGLAETYRSALREAYE
jgi:AcrR family transcriptional regulator